MKRRKSHAFSDLITGIFMLAVLLALGYFTIVISGVDIVNGKERVPMTINFRAVGGLKEHDAVMYRGTKVGAVERIELTDDGLKVRLEVDKSVKIRTGYSATVCALTMLGGNYLQLDEGDGEEIDYSSAELTGSDPIDWMRDVAKVANNLKEITESDEIRNTISNVCSISAKAEAIVSRVEAGEGLAGKMLSKDVSLYNDVTSTVFEAKAAFAHANSITARFDDEKLVQELRDGISAFRKACESMDFGDSVKGDVREVSESAKRLLASLNEMVDRAKNGQGTLGRLMKDDGMYNEVEGLIFDVRQILDNYRDTTPIATFSSLATGAL